MNARSLLCLPLLSISLGGCADDPEATKVSQLGLRVVPAAGTRVETNAMDWKTIDDRLAALGLDRASGVLDFVPDAGTYGFAEKLFREDGCGIAEGSAEFSHDIHGISTKKLTYKDSYIASGEEEPALTTSCDLSSHTYRCKSSKTTIDFGVLGLAAVVTIQNDNFGSWSASDPRFVGVFPYELSCKGADCDKAPAKDLFGMLSGSMPCTGIEAARYQK